MPLPLTSGSLYTTTSFNTRLQVPFCEVPGCKFNRAIDTPVARIAEYKPLPLVASYNTVPDFTGAVTTRDSRRHEFYPSDFTAPTYLCDECAKAARGYSGSMFTRHALLTELHGHLIRRSYECEDHTDHRRVPCELRPNIPGEQATGSSGRGGSGNVGNQPSVLLLC